jgi:hypothetical protein
MKNSPTILHLQMLFTLAVTLGATTVGTGCATSLGILHAATGEWPSTSSHEYVDWVNGEPERTVTVEARLSTPPRAVCHTTVDEPPAITHHEEAGFDMGGRLAVGFIGVGELAIGLLPMVLSPDDLGPAGYATLGFFALDGLASLVLAALIPDFQKRWEAPRPANRWDSPECPTELFFEVGLERFALGPDGELLPGDARYVMTQVVEAGLPLGLRHGDRLDVTEVPRDIRCAWADHLGHPAVRALCPQAPVVIQPPPPPPPRRVLVPVPVPVPR